MKRSELDKQEYDSYYQLYLSQVDDTDLIAGLDTNRTKVTTFLEAIPEAHFDFAYAEGKWNIKEIVQHIMDTERVFTARALRFARKDDTVLPGYDHNLFAKVSNARERSKQSLIEEYTANRLSTLAMYKSFTNDMLKQVGNANRSDISVRAIGFILIGHENHHCNIIKERYL